MTDRSKSVEEVLAAGTRIEEFVIERALQSGGFGVTYLAEDRSLGRRVAIKEYLPREWGGRRADGSVGPRSSSCAEDYKWGLTRFLEEARTLACLDHARIVRVYRVIEARGTAYMAMEYVEGRNLEETLRAEGPWPEARVRALLAALLPGLELVHGAGLVHRDIKPANVMLRADGTPVLIDFGAARYAAGAHSRSLTSVLTPGYAPHEQYHQTAGKQGPWTDVYALGAVAYRALSGRTPAEAPARVESAARKQADPLSPVAASAGEVSEEFGAAVASALALWPEDRPGDVPAWRAQWDAGAALAPTPVQERPVPLPPRAGGFLRPARAAGARPPAQRPWLAAALAALVLAAGVAGGLLIGQRAAPSSGGRVADLPPGGEAPAPAVVEEALGLDLEAWRLIRLGLRGAEFDPGPEEGDPGPRTRAALADWQRSQEIDATGYLDAENMRKLLAAGRRAEAEEQRLAAKAETVPRPGAVFSDCDACPEMVVIPAGDFMMGSPASEEGRWDDEGPQHRVAVSSFALGRYEVTRDEYRVFAETTGHPSSGCRIRNEDSWTNDDDASWREPGFAQGSGHPAVCVNWNDAQAYVRWLSRETGESYRLPSEAEWEYAARGGAPTSRYWGDSSSSQCGHANGADAAAKRVYPERGQVADCDDGAVHTTLAGSYSANAFGLFDVLGNVWEWTADCWHESYRGAPADGSPWHGGGCGRRVLRGGSWRLTPRLLRSAARTWAATEYRSADAGFRVARTLD